MKKLQPLDFIFSAAVLILGIFLTIKNISKKGSVVKVNVNGNHYEYSADKDGIYKVEGPLGITTFEIKNSRVRIIDSPCQNKNCIKQCWHSPNVCLPNNVIITHEDEREVDAISE